MGPGPGAGNGTGVRFASPPTGLVQPVTAPPCEVGSAVDYGGASGPTGPVPLPRFGHFAGPLRAATIAGMEVITPRRPISPRCRGAAPGQHRVRHPVRRRRRHDGLHRLRDPAPDRRPAGRPAGCGADDHGHRDLGRWPSSRRPGSSSSARAAWPGSSPRPAAAGPPAPARCVASTTCPTMSRSPAA